MVEIWRWQCQFSELCSSFYDYFSQPRLSGHGKVIVAVFHERFKCHPIEMAVSKVNCSTPTLCAIVYCPHRSIPEFLPDFSDLLLSMFLTCNRIILLGDFKIHPSDAFVADFLNVVSSFGLQPHVLGPTHTMDLVLKYWPHRFCWPIHTGPICILIDIILHTEMMKETSKICSCTFDGETVSKILSTFPANNNIPPKSLDPDKLMNEFNLLCTSVLYCTF